MANVIAIIGVSRRPSGTAAIGAIGATGAIGPIATIGTIEELWRDLAGASGPLLGDPEGAARLFRDCAADVLQGVAYADRTGMFLNGAGGAGGSGDDPAAAVAGQLGLHGPAVTVHGPALAAVERACQSLLAAECDLALAGEAMAALPGMAALTALTALTGMVALKRLPAALAAGDPILAVIDGSAVQALAPPPPPVPQVRRDQAEIGAPTAPRERPALANPYRPPLNPLEAAIARVWQDELGIDQVGVDDNFFELGGTSIAGVKIIALLKEWLHQTIPTVSLYEGPTVRALAQVLLHSGPVKEYDAMRERGERRRRKLQRLQGLARAEE
jgi:acyl carrier protein